VEEAAVVVEGLNGLVVESHLVSQQQVVDRSLGAVGVLQEVQSIRWGKQVKQLGEHRQVEAYPPGDGRQGKSREGAVAVVAYQRKAAADNVAVGLASREVEARGVGARPLEVNLLFGLKNKQEVGALVAFGQQQPCSLVCD